MAITAPTFAKNAVPSLKGWHHPRTNELLKARKISQSDLDEFFGVPKLHKGCPDCDENGNCTCDDIPEELEDMTKLELEAYAREHHDVELDRRRGKKTLLKQLASIIKR
jgi:hypothetical protein